MVEVSNPPAAGKSTVEPYIAVCQCGKARFKVAKRTTTAITLECLDCNKHSSVKGYVAPVRVSAGEVEFAVKEKVVRPSERKVSKADGDDTENDVPTKKDKGRTLRFGFSEDQVKVVQRSLDVVRVINWGDEAYKKQQWQGLALEFICADFLSGVDARILDVLDQMDIDVHDAVQLAEKRNPGKPLPRRKEREIRAATRDKLAKDLGIVAGYKAPQLSSDEQRSINEYTAADEAKRADAESDDRILDNGALYRLIGDDTVEYSYTIRAETGERPDILIGKPSQYSELLKRWKDKGGYLFRVLGDIRTVSPAGQRPAMFLWFEKLDGAIPDLDLSYIEHFAKEFDDPMIGIVEYRREEFGLSGVTDNIEDVKNES